METEYGLEQRAARNLLTFLREQARDRRRPLRPRDRGRALPRRDRDWRVCVLTPFGGRVHAPWAMALRARLRDSLDVDVQSLWSDDGIALHFPDADVPPPVADLLLDPKEIEDLLLVELAQSALYGARFRENAARALLIPRRRPGQRTPLWQQRLKAQSLLQVARRFPQFPIVLETYRSVSRTSSTCRRCAEYSRDSRRASSTWSRSRRRPRRRSRHRSSSTTWPRTCTRTTLLRRSGARRRSPSTATSSVSSWGSKSFGSSSTPAPSRRSSGRYAARRGTLTSCTTCSGEPGHSSTASTTAGSPRPSFVSAARFAFVSATPSSSPPSRTRVFSVTRSASPCPVAFRRCSSSRSSGPCGRLLGVMQGPRPVHHCRARGTLRSRAPVRRARAGGARARGRARPRRASAGWFRARVV